MIKRDGFHCFTPFVVEVNPLVGVMLHGNHGAAYKFLSSYLPQYEEKIALPYWKWSNAISLLSGSCMAQSMALSPGLNILSSGQIGHIVMGIVWGFSKENKNNLSTQFRLGTQTLQRKGCTKVQLGALMSFHWGHLQEHGWLKCSSITENIYNVGKASWKLCRWSSLGHLEVALPTQEPLVNYLGQSLLPPQILTAFITVWEESHESWSFSRHVGFTPDCYTTLDQLSGWNLCCGALRKSITSTVLTFLMGPLEAGEAVSVNGLGCPYTLGH